jgi:uncharacterized protein (TIGR02266 family)
MPVTVARGGEALAVLVRDISCEAVFVVARDPFPVGTLVTVTFGLPGKDGPLRVGGRVVRVVESASGGEPGMAIRFNVLSGADQVRLDFFIALQAG